MQKKLPVYLINLERDREKRLNVTEQLTNNSIGFKLVKAIDGSKLDEKFINEVYNKEQFYRVNDRNANRGEIGCLLSHLEIYREIISNDIDNCLIFEDDIVIHSGFSSMLKDILSLDINYDFILLNYTNNHHLDTKSRCSLWGKVKVNNTVLSRPIETCFGTSAYIVSNSGARKVLKEIENKGICKPIDHFTGDFHTYNVYVESHRFIRLVDNADEKSSIGPSRVSGHLSILQKIKQKARNYYWYRFSRDLFWSIFYSIKSLIPFKFVLNRKV